MLSRRRFIGLVGVGGLSAAIASLRFLQSHSPLVKDLELKTLSKRHASLMASVFSAILAVTDETTLKLSVLKADVILEKFSRRNRLELMGALEVLEQSPLWQINSFQKFSSLSNPDQIQVLKKWSSGARAGRALTQGLKEFSVFVFYSQDFTWPEIGYDGPLVRK